MLGRSERRLAHHLVPKPPSLDEENDHEDPAMFLDAELGEIAEYAPELRGNPSSDLVGGE